MSRISNCFAFHLPLIINYKHSKKVFFKFYLEPGVSITITFFSEKRYFHRFFFIWSLRKCRIVCFRNH